MRMRIGAARSILRVSICSRVEVRIVPVLTAVFGAYAVLEQPPRPATMSAKKQAFAKTDAVCFKRNALPTLPSPGRGAYRPEVTHMGMSREIFRMAARHDEVARRSRPTGGRGA